ncbi:MAG: hybrid sensor histidine kinase/response regulator [Nitrospiraceae bacterium]|nr:hybrid sensor histidine kinase/response regulator [Nitrospiraceae bacterium]
MGGERGNSGFNRQAISHYSNFSVNELISNIVHELNNPLAAVIGFSQVLQSMDSDQQIKRYVDNIQSAAVRSAKIVEGLLIFLRRESMQYNIVDLNEIVLHTIDLFDYHIKTGCISKTVSLSETPVLVNGDYYRLQQVVFNLLMNAIQAFSEWEGLRELEVTVRRVNGLAEIVVSDSGPGICREYIDKVFMPFFTTKKEGTGLGLSISQGVLIEHGGDIEVYSDEKGTKLTARIPAINTEGESSLVLKNEPVEKKRVLVIEKSPLVSDALAAMLVASSCEVVCAENFDNALKYIKDDLFDFVFVDYNSGSIGIVEFINKATAHISPQNFAFLTSDITISDKILNNNFSIPVLRKPFGMEDIKRVINRR